MFFQDKVSTMSEINIYEGDMEDDDVVEYVQRVRRRMLINAADTNGDIENNEGNSILLRDLANTAIASKRLRQNDKALDNQAQNAELAQSIIDRMAMGNGNALAGGTTIVQYMDADIDDVGPDINPDTTTLGRQQLSLEDAGVDTSDC